MSVLLTITLRKNFETEAEARTKAEAIKTIIDNEEDNTFDNFDLSTSYLESIAE